MSEYKYIPLGDNVEEMFIGPFGSSLKNECFVDEDEAYCMVYEQKHAIQKTMDVETRYVNEQKYNELKRFNVHGGDIIVSCRGTIGETFIVPDDAPLGIMHPSIMKIRLKEGVYDKYYFNLLLKSRLKKHEAEANGSGIKMAISATELGKELFPVPTMEEQLEITDIISRIRSVIEKRKQELSALDNLIKARFVELFGDPITNPRGYTKLTVAEAIESGYIEKPFDGNHGSKHPKASEYVDVGVPFLMANNVIDGTVDQINCSFITEERAKKLDKGFAKDNDVLITHKGTIGRTAVLRTDYDFVMLTPQVAAYRVKEGITADYLCGYFATEFFQNDIKILAAAGGSTRAYAGITAQLQLHIIIPPLDEQKVYTDFIKQVDKSKFMNSKCLMAL